MYMCVCVCRSVCLCVCVCVCVSVTGKPLLGLVSVHIVSYITYIPFDSSPRARSKRVFAETSHIPAERVPHTHAIPTSLPV